MAAVAAVSTLRYQHMRPSMIAGNARLHAFGSRSPQQRSSAAAAKFDAALADLSRHASLARPDHALNDLRALAPGVRFRQAGVGAVPLVLIDAVTVGDPQKLKAALVGLGLQRASVYANDVGGWLPVTELDAATAYTEVHSIRASMSHRRSGAAMTQGDFAQHSDVVRSANALTGAGVTVGVLSDSFDCYSVYAANHVAAAGAVGYASNGFLATAADDVTSGDLPATVTLAAANSPGDPDCMASIPPGHLPLTDEGRAMLQIVHDIAPGAGLAFYAADNSEADFANGIASLAAAGAKVIADDIGYFDEPFFQDGIISQAIDAAEAQGVAYFVAAGNDGNSAPTTAANPNVALAYDNTTPVFSTVSTAAPNTGEHLLNFDASGATTTTSLPVTIASLVPGEFVAIVVEWDQPYVTGAPTSGGATSHIDVCITGASGTDTITDYSGNAVNCTGPNATGADSYQIMIVGNPVTATANTAAETLNIQVGLGDGTAAPGLIKVAVEDNGAGSTINAFQTNSATIQGHAGAAGAISVGAAFFYNTPSCGTTPASIEYFSSQGGAPILFDSAGSRLATPIVRKKPDVVGPNGGNNTFLGFTLATAGVTNGLLSTSIAACQNSPGFPNFFGTSAATPHVAGIAALMLQANPAVTPTQIYDALRNSALPMSSSSSDYNAGSGFVQADAAMALIPQVVPAAPTLTLAQSSLTAGGSTTITWSSTNATGCTATGSWTGALASSGSQTLTPSAAGTDTYTLTCANSAGSSPAASVSLTVTNATITNHSGGGGLDILALLGLAGLGVAQMLRLRPRVVG